MRLRRDWRCAAAQPAPGAELIYPPHRRIMNDMAEPFYITTPIYYPNAEPHLGHCYCTLAADTVARYQRLKGRETFFLTGTDEHGVKMVKTAAEKGMEPAALAQSVSDVFRSLWAELHVTNDDFIRTTEPRHERAVGRIVEKLLANGDIYLGSYEGWYDEGQEEFVTETEAKNHEFKSVITGRPLVRYQEPTYFFKLSHYAPKVLEYIERHPEFIQPDSRRNEVVSKLKQGVADLSISRSSLQWGIPMPNDPAHVVYVWIDALSNYITALGYGGDDPSRLEKFWPVNVHLIGKEILWFHAVYWPSMLMALGLALPKMIYAHGWWTSGGRKMSKTLGNAIDLVKLRQIIAMSGEDALRYYLLRAAGFGGDLDWTDADFATSYNELGNVVGNCLNRVLNMAGKYLGGVVPAFSAADQAEAPFAAFHEAYQRFGAKLDQHYEALELQECLLLPVELARLTNGYIDSRAPFKLAKDPAKAEELKTVMGNAIQAIYRVLVGLLAVLPHKAAEGLAQMGVDVAGKSLADLLEKPLPPGHQLGAGKPLFPKMDIT